MAMKEDPNKKKQEERSPEEKRKSALQNVLEYLLYIVGAIVVCLLIIRFVAVRSVIEGSSMFPTFKDKENVIVEKISYYFHGPERYDVIVFELKDNPQEHFVKRVIGLPGETVQILNGYVYINGEKLEDDDFCNELIANAYTAKDPITLGEDEYFCMGDNRNHSNDSRSKSVGPVTKKQILGRVCFRFWPLDRITGIGKAYHGQTDD